MNLRSEVNMPGDLIDFEACNGESEIVGLNSSPYSLSFGQKSDFDTANKQIFKDYSDKFLNKENSKSYFDMMNDYMH